MSSPSKLFVLVLLALSALTTPCQALDILLTNDDGFESSLLHALYQRLKQSGHSVVISAPAMENSGMGGALPTAPIGRLPTPSRSAHIPIGAPGVGALASDPDVYYVNSTPAVSLLHGLDIAARRKWGKAPDLVISGPNFGHNTGPLTTHSGTFNAAMTALSRGVPAISVSFGALLNWYRPFNALRAGAIEYEVADLMVRLVGELVRTGEEAKPLLPLGVGLNVNVPEFLPRTGGRLQFRFGKVGAAVFATPFFVENLAADPIIGLTLPPPLPGISGYLPGISPQTITRIDDRDPSSEQNLINAGFVAISVVQSTHQADMQTAAAISSQLTSLTQPSAR